MGKVKWTNTKDSVTVTMQCSCGDERGKWATKSWKNWCPGCKKSGGLVGHKPPSQNLTKWKGKNAPEGEISCKYCGFDACGVHGREKINGSKKRLKPAGGVTSKTASSSSVQAAKCEVSKAEARKKTKKTLKANSKPVFKATLTSPMLKNLKADSFCGLNKKVFPHIPKEQLYINTVKVDVDNQKMTIDLLEEMPPPSTEYKDENNENGNVSSNYGEGIEKTLKLKGKELKTFDKIFQYARVGGKYGMKYAYYYDHKKGGSFDKFDAASAKYCWENKVANCCDLTWIIRKMCEGAGVDCGVVHGKATFKVYGTVGHLWNTYKGKRKDGTSRTARNYKIEKVIIKG